MWDLYNVDIKQLINYIIKKYYKTDVFVPNMCNIEMAGFIGVYYHYI
jgi:hypothetical protein